LYLRLAGLVQIVVETVRAQFGASNSVAAQIRQFRF
jgi:hypothetical protein